MRKKKSLLVDPPQKKKTLLKLNLTCDFKGKWASL